MPDVFTKEKRSAVMSRIREATRIQSLRSPDCSAHRVSSEVSVVGQRFTVAK